MCSVRSVSVSLALLVAACGGPPAPGPSASPGDRALAQQAEWDAQKPGAAPGQATTCFEGTVQSTGVFGRPLDGVAVELEMTDAGTKNATTRTDARGNFHVCIEKTNLGVVRLEPFGPTPQYRDRNMKLRITFTRPGYTPKTLERELDTFDRSARLDVLLVPESGNTKQE
jgi:hypothetical protein